MDVDSGQEYVYEDEEEAMFREQEALRTHNGWHPSDNIRVVNDRNSLNMHQNSSERGSRLSRAPNTSNSSERGSRFSQAPNTSSLRERRRSRSLQAPSTSNFKVPGSSRLSQAPNSSGPTRRPAAPKQYRVGFITRETLRLNTCKSPSTDSTTSLRQLRERLTILSPVQYSKVPQKIASTPELAVLRELDEENSSNSVRNTKHCGDKYRSDGEARAVKGNRKPVSEDHSASSAVNQTSKTATDAVFEELYANNPNLDLADLLIVEALEHYQEKDGGKITQDSDVVENTPAENEIRFKKSSLRHNAKITLQKKLAIDEPDLEVIEDTPCYVFDRKQRNRSKSNKIIDETNAPVDLTDDEDFFYQYFNQNNLENVLSPSLGRKMNATSSEDSDDELPIITEDHNVKKEQHAHDLAIAADVAECVNNILVSVCNNMDNYNKSQKQRERQIELRSTKRNLDKSNISMDISKTRPEPKSDKNDTKKVAKSRKIAPKMNTGKKTAKKDEDKVKEEMKDKIGTHILAEKTNTSSPITSTNATIIRKKRKLYSPKDDEIENNENMNPKAETRQSNISETPTFYSELEKARKSQSILPKKPRYRTQTKKKSNKKDVEDPPFEAPRRSSFTSVASTPTRNRSERPVKPVKYINAHFHTKNSSSDDDDFKHSRTGKPNIVKKTKTASRKVGKLSKTQPVISPKTRKLNEMFDKIKKDVVNNEKITLVEKTRSQKDSIYNLSSDSENGDFKKTNVSLRKRVSPVCVDMPSRKRRRSISRVNYSEHSSTENEGKKTKQSKPVKEVKRRNCKANISYPTPLVDERMRIAHQESLETSFVKETVDDNNLEEPEPVLHRAPALEVMRPDKLSEAIAGDKTPSKLNTTKIKKENYNKKTTKSIAAKRSKENVKRVSKENDSASVSPLPGLVVETVRTRKDDLTASLETNLLQKFKNMVTNAQVSSEQPDFTQNSSVYADENDNAVLDPNDILDTALVADDISEKSIATGGYSPITAHNDLNKSPPNIELLHEEFNHRDVRYEHMDESMTELLANMRNRIQTNNLPRSRTSRVIPISRMSARESTRSNVCAKKIPPRESINKTVPNTEPSKTPTKEKSQNKIISPKSQASVVLTRMSSEEIERHLTRSHSKSTSNFGSPKIVLERISPDEISKWLPMPASKDKSAYEKPKKINKRKLSISIEKTPETVVKKKIKTKISPIRLSFHFASLTTDRSTAKSRTRSKSIKSPATTKKETLQTEINSSAPKSNSADKNNQEIIKSVVSLPETTAPTVSSDVNRSVECVNDWFNKNATQSASGAAANHLHREIFSRVMEAIQTTLPEIDMTTNERLLDRFLKEQQEINILRRDATDFSKRLIDHLLKNQEQLNILTHEMTGICDRLTAFENEMEERRRNISYEDAKQKQAFFNLLKDDIMRLLNTTKGSREN